MTRNAPPLSPRALRPLPLPVQGGAGLGDGLPLALSLVPAQDLPQGEQGGPALRGEALQLGHQPPPCVGEPSAAVPLLRVQRPRR